MTAFGQERTFESFRKVAFRASLRDPGLFAAGPNMNVRLQPARIVQRPGLTDTLSWRHSGLWYSRAGAPGHATVSLVRRFAGYRWQHANRRLAKANLY